MKFCPFSDLLPLCHRTPLSIDWLQNLIQAYFTDLRNREFYRLE